LARLDAARGDPRFGTAHEAQQQVCELNDLRSFDGIGEFNSSVAGGVLEGANGTGEQFHRRDLLTPVCASIG
jgi:hypothetical protein